MTVTTRVYDSYAQAQQVVTNLEKLGVPSADISMIANQHVSNANPNVENATEAGPGAGIGAAVGGGAGLLAGLGLMAIPGIGPVVAAGWLAATAVGAAAGAATGGLIGAMIDSGVPEEHAHVYSETVRRGGTLVTVRTTAIPAEIVSTTMNGYQPVDAAVRREEYSREGWTKFDPNAPPYTPSAAELERIRRS